MMDILLVMSTDPSICQTPGNQQPCCKCLVANAGPQHIVVLSGFQCTVELCGMSLVLGLLYDNVRLELKACRKHCFVVGLM